MTEQVMGEVTERGRIMGNVNINYANVEQTAVSLAARARTEIAGAGETACTNMLGILEISSGEFADSLRAEIQKEQAVLQKTGNLLAALADYIQTAAKDFAATDQSHQRTRVNA